MATSSVSASIKATRWPTEPGACRTESDPWRTESLPRRQRCRRCLLDIREFKRIHLQSNGFGRAPVTTASTMEPLSARIPSDLYLWLAQLRVEGATTNSDKLRVLLNHL